MTAWRDVEAAVPELAAAARGLLDAHTHKTIATLRRDGAPRISGIEAVIADGELTFGSMPDAVKALDLRRDPRFALHSGSADPPGWRGDAKVAGRAVEAPREPGAAHHFRADITELSVVRLGEPADHIVIESWTPERGLRTLRR